MKCSACYADNAAWVTTCTKCGEPTLPIELCGGGHILPPGVRECAICGSSWPALPSFTGPMILRGLLLVESGLLLNPANPTPLAFLELRDGETPLAFEEGGKGHVLLAAPESREAVARLAVRPDGVRLCLKEQAATVRRTAKLAWEVLATDGLFQVGGALFRYVAVDVPPWAEHR